MVRAPKRKNERRQQKRQSWWVRAVFRKLGYRGGNAFVQFPYKLRRQVSMIEHPAVLMEFMPVIMAAIDVIADVMVEGPAAVGQSRLQRAVVRRLIIVCE